MGALQPRRDSVSGPRAVRHCGEELIGFVALKLNPETQVGEIGLNAVDPAHGGKGFGTAMYDFAVRWLKQASPQRVDVPQALAVMLRHGPLETRG